MTRLTDPLKLDASRGFPTYLRTEDGALVAEIGEKGMARRIHAAINATRTIPIDALEAAARDGKFLAAYQQLQQQRDSMLAVLKELEESAAYWSEYDVPLGIAGRIQAAIAEAAK